MPLEKPSLPRHLTSIGWPVFACLCQPVCLSVPGSYTSLFSDTPSWLCVCLSLCATPQNTHDVEAGQHGAVQRACVTVCVPVHLLVC